MTDAPQNPWPHVYTEQQWADIAYDNDAMSEEYNLQRKLRLMLKPLPSERALDMLAVCLNILNEELAGTWDSATARMQRELAAREAEESKERKRKQKKETADEIAV